MVWLYRLQQRIAITGAECAALLTLLFLLFLGLIVQYVQRQPEPLSEDVYAASDRQFEAGTAALRAAAQPPGTAADPLPEAAAPVAKQEQQEEPAPAEGQLQLDLNRATPALLERLPRIGPKTAARIVAYREAHGPFARVDDLVRVSGIGPKTLARLKPYLYVTAAGAP